MSRMDVQQEFGGSASFSMATGKRVTWLDQVVMIVRKDTKIRFSNPQTYIYTFGFPLMLTFMFYYIFGTNEMVPGWRVYDVVISGMIVFAASFSTVNAAVSLTLEKEKGTLKRLDTTSVSRTSLFLATLITESIFLCIQIALMMLISYTILGLRWDAADPFAMVAGFGFAFIFGLSSLGIGIVISAYAKTIANANGLAMMYVMPLIYLSGAMAPFESPIQYFIPAFWASQLFKQVVIMGHDFWTGFVQISSKDPFVNQFLPIPLWCGFLILVGIVIAMIALGIVLFQKKTAES
jgi:ABC-type transport system involved in multi-copper enzyme maturation permease subunit